MANLTGAVAPASTLAAIPYPGKILKIGSGPKSLVKTLQHRLNEVGCGPIDEDGDFGERTDRAVRLFQARFTDQEGQPLMVDGEVGSLTWSRLFGSQTVPVTNAPASPLLQKALDIAATQIGVLEHPLGSNRGPEVDTYLRSAGIDPTTGHFAWCAAFVYFCFDQAAAALHRNNPLVKTGGVMAHWNGAGTRGIPRITHAKARQNPSLIKPGHIFVIDLGSGLGHTGLVERVVGGKLVTIEGNTNDNGSREGIGVFRRESRKIEGISKGFIDYGGE